MICKKCNFQNTETAKFCRNCGAKISKPSKQPNYVVWDYVVWVILIIILAGGVIWLYSTNKDKGKQLFVNEKCDQNTKLITPNLRKNNDGNTFIGTVLYPYCVVSDKAFVYDEPNGKILGYLIKYDKVKATKDADWSKEGFVEIFNGGSQNFLGWIKLSDIMEVDLFNFNN